MATNFENHIMKCCKADEWDLRRWLKKVLTRSGFTIFEDDYVTSRADNEPRYKEVHNLLAIRGDKPKVCLVAHTDVCRNHGFSSSRSSNYTEYNQYIYGQKEETKSKIVEPILKDVEIDGKTFRIITEKDNKVQVGGDDRLGVAINSWIALNTGYDMGLLFTTDEEIGLKSADKCKFTQLKNFDICVQTDRGNHTDELVTQIGGTKLCDYGTMIRLLEIAYDIDLPRKPIVGYSTDVAALKRNGVINNAVNMTCGYHNSNSDSPLEYIHVQEAQDTMRFVSEIVKNYYLNP